MLAAWEGGGWQIVQRQTRRQTTSRGLPLAQILATCTQDQGSQINLKTISCPSQILIDDSIDSAEKLLLFPKAMLGEVLFLENVPILLQLKFVMGFHENSACGCCIWGSGVFGYLSGGSVSFILLMKFSNYSVTAIAVVLRQYSIYLLYFHIFID